MAARDSAFAPEGHIARSVEAFDALTIKLTQLDAALAHTTCDSFEAFDSLADDVKRSYLLMCSDFARDARLLLRQLGQVR